MLKVRTRRLLQQQSRPLADVPPTSLRWQTPVSTVWFCFFPTETVTDELHDMCWWSTLFFLFVFFLTWDFLCRCRNCRGRECSRHQEVASDSAHSAQWDHQAHGQDLWQHHCTIQTLVDGYSSVDGILTFCALSLQLFCLTFCLNSSDSQVPMARASILWLMGEYCEKVPKIAPDVLRKMAKSFTTEEDIVKLQIVNLAAKLYLTNSKQVKY